MTGAATWTYPTLDPHISTMAGNLIGLQAMYNGLVALEAGGCQDLGTQAGGRPGGVLGTAGP